MYVWCVCVCVCVVCVCVACLCMVCVWCGVCVWCVYVWRVCVWCVCVCGVCVCVVFFLNLLLTSMFHYRIAILHAKRFLLQILVTPNNTLYILYLSIPSYVLSSYLLNVHMEGLLLLNIFVTRNINHLQNLQNFKIYTVHKPLKEFCVLVC